MYAGRYHKREPPLRQLKDMVNLTNGWMDKCGPTGRLRPASQAWGPDATTTATPQQVLGGIV